ncbi:hypothetical protein AVEN_3559-1 [Araneus ventricosus]|uniref:Uncharacterized protein n=1 Tax=Araneus ventricosus TaxID=182803 RepID=A0A4Y2SDN2_ARAVE|nr:hypothetical protein AVEN_3559-1 [Araneus ventricosus]
MIDLSQELSPSGTYFYNFKNSTSEMEDIGLLDLNLMKHFIWRHTSWLSAIRMMDVGKKEDDKHPKMPRTKANTSFSVEGKHFQAINHHPSKTLVDISKEH